jgi:fructoselysine-6-P-deglycase FrlB-like protein
MRAPFASLLPFVLLLGCGGSETALTASNTPVAATETAGSATTAAEGPVDFTAADLDLYEKGITKEIGIVKAALARASNAPTPDERAAAAQASW